MKKISMKKTFFSAVIFPSLFTSLFGFHAVAQNRGPAQASTQDSNQTTSTARASMDRKKYLMEQGVEKYLITLDYNSWFEKLTIANATGTFQDSQALYYGFGLGLEKNWYHGKWGWGLGAGVLGGSATGGDKSGTLTYFQARVPWWAARVAPRVFYRWTGRTDLGIDMMAFYRNATWPDPTNTLTVTSGSQIANGIFVDMRVRFNPKVEMIQSFGMIYKDESIYWRLGLAYRL